MKDFIVLVYYAAKHDHKYRCKQQIRVAIVKLRRLHVINTVPLCVIAQLKMLLATVVIMRFNLGCEIFPIAVA